MNDATHAQVLEIKSDIDRLLCKLRKRESERLNNIRKLEYIIKLIQYRPKSEGLKNKRLKLATKIEGDLTYETELN